jgi:hypothetical protein
MNTTSSAKRLTRCASRHASPVTAVEYSGNEKLGSGCSATYVSQDTAYTKDGLTILPCPAMTRGITCGQCRLCLDDSRLRQRRIAIGFAAHSQGANKARMALAVVD